MIMLMMSKIRRTSYFIAILCSWCIFCTSVVTTTAEELAARLDRVVQDTSRQELYTDALGILEEGVRIIEGAGDEVASALQQAVSIYTTAGYVLLHIGRHDQLEPTKRASFNRATELLRDGLHIVQDYNFSIPDNQLHFWKLLGDVYIELRQNCPAAEYYNQLYEHFQRDLHKIDEDMRLNLLTSIGTCWPDQGVELWNQALQLGFLSVENPYKCRRCWLLLLTANARASGGLERAYSLFRSLNLQEHTPFEHALQVPQVMNTALTTERSTTFLKPKEYAVCRALQEHKAEIIQEYQQYRKRVQSGEIQDLHDPHHDDMLLSEPSGGGWDGLHLRRVVPVEAPPGDDGNIGWQTQRCKNLFNKTCTILADIPEVNGRLLLDGGPQNCGSHNNSGYPDWCLGMEGRLPGVIAFWKLQPGGIVRLHGGATNQRIKCHLVVDDGGKRAWIQVGETRRSYRTGDVIAFDDSYLHMVGNDGKKERVILDVTFYQPDLITDQHEQGTADPDESKSDL